MQMKMFKFTLLPVSKPRNTMYMPKVILLKMRVQTRTGYQYFNIAKSLTNGHLLVDVKGAGNFQWWLLLGKCTFRHCSGCQSVSVSTEITLSQGRIPSGLGRDTSVWGSEPLQGARLS